MIGFHVLYFVSLIAQTTGGSDVPWYIAAITGPVGLTVFAVLQNHKKEKIIAEKDEEIKRLNEERKKDLVSGMDYREQVAENLLKDNIEDRETGQKMIDAMNALVQNLEQNNGTTQEVRDVVQRIERLATRLEGRIQGGGSTPDLGGAGS